MKKLAIILSLINVSVFAVGIEAVTVISDVPAQQKETAAKIDTTKTLQYMITAVNKAQTTQEQINALKRLSDLQKNPASSIVEVNNAVNGLISNFNTLNNSSFQSLSQLINGLATSSNTLSSNIQLMQASNMQLSAISSTLNTLQAQNQAIIAYKQAEINEEEKSKQAKKQRVNSTAKALNGL